MTFETPDKANAAMFGRLSMQLNDQSPDYASLLVANRVLGGDSDSRMFQRVRVKGGLSYAVGTVFQPIGDRPEQHARPLRDLRAAESREGAHRDRGGDRAGARGRLHRAGNRDGEKGGCSRSGASRARRTTRSSGALVAQAYLGRTWAESAKIDAAIAAVTPESATAALRKYVEPADIAFAYAGDFAKK